jgi:hypothetical protein
VQPLEDDEDLLGELRLEPDAVVAHGSATPGGLRVVPAASTRVARTLTTGGASGRGT